MAMRSTRGKKRQPSGLVSSSISREKVDDVLIRAGLGDLPEHSQSSLFAGINELLALFGALAEWRRVNVPSKRIARIESLRQALMALKPFAKDTYIREAVVWAEGFVSGFQPRSRPTDDGDLLGYISGRSHDVFPAADSPAGRQMWSLLFGSALWCVERLDALLVYERAQQDHLQLLRKSGEADADEIRFAFVLSLSHQFETLTGHSPAATEDGQWCAFLSCLLTEVQSHTVTPATAKKVFSQARKWAGAQTTPPSKGRNRL